MKSKIVITFILVLLVEFAFAQKGTQIIEKESNWQERVYLGGGFGFNGGSNSFGVSLSPIVGYMLNNRVSVGVGATYEYFKYESAFLTYNDNRYGGMLFGRVNLAGQIFAYGEYSFFNFAYSGDNNDRRTVTRLPIGLGLSQPIGPRSSFNIIAAYDMIYDEQGPYASPWVFNMFFSL